MLPWHQVIDIPFLGLQRACCDAYGIMISVVTSDEAHWYVLLCCAESGRVKCDSSCVPAVVDKRS